MHKLLADQIAQARSVSGETDIHALIALVSRAYRERDGRLRDSRRALRRQLALFGTALETMAHGFSMYDARGRLMACNRQFLEIYRLPKSCGRVGTSFRHILECRVSANTHEGDDPVGYVRKRLELIGGDRVVHGVAKLNTGQMISVTHTPMADGGWVSTHRDITELHHMQTELTHLAYHDPLTDLPNRNYLYQRLQRAFDLIDDTGGFAVLCLDLDGFKQVNDTLGHSSGDRLLKEIAARLRATIGPDDLVGRMGGDEFALVTSVSTAAAARTLADALRDAVRAPFDIDGQTVAVALSVGMALAPNDGGTPDELLKSADIALYAAKREARGTVRAFDPAIDRADRDRRGLERDLKLALERGEFELVYQPIVNLRSNSFSGFEALLRWQHPVRGTVTPAAFIGVAEELGLIVPIGEWVLREALTEATHWPSHLRIAVNVSSAQFIRGNMVATMMHALAAAQITPDRVEIEITESVFLESSETNLEALRQLHVLGLKIALDDFGTGYSALSYLLRFPFDKIKIDGTFVRALNNAEAAHTIVRSVAEIGDRMGLITTAEGVETAEQLRNVHALGYTEAQGYLIARPMPAAQVRRMLGEEADNTALDKPYARAAGWP